MADETSEVMDEGKAKKAAEDVVDAVIEPAPPEARGLLGYPLSRVSPAVMEEIRTARMRLKAALDDFPIKKIPNTDGEEDKAPWEAQDMERAVKNLDFALKATTVGEMMAHLKQFFDWTSYSVKYTAEMAGHAGEEWEQDHLGDGVLVGLKDRPWVRFFSMNPQAWDERVAKILFGTSLVADVEDA